MVDPAKRGAKLTRFGLAMLDFRRSIASSPRAPDRVSFREQASSPPPALAHPFALRLGATQFTGGSVLVGAYYTNIYLGYETIFESPGAVTGTLSSRGGGGLSIPLPRVLQVSIGLDL